MLLAFPRKASPRVEDEEKESRTPKTGRMVTKMKYVGKECHKCYDTRRHWHNCKKTKKVLSARKVMKLREGGKPTTPKGIAADKLWRSRRRARGRGEDAYVRSAAEHSLRESKEKVGE